MTTTTTPTTITGFNELIERLRLLGAEFSKVKTARMYNRALNFAMQPVRDTVHAVAPKRSGQMANMVYQKAHKPTARDKRSRSYMGEQWMARVGVGSKRDESTTNTILLKGTTKKGLPKTRKYIVFHGSNRPVVLAEEYGTPISKHNVATHFLTNTFYRDAALVEQRLGQALWYELQQLDFMKLKASESK
jgi:hypothetical protein